MRDARERLIVALDVSSAAAAQKIVAAVGDSARYYKVGLQLYTAEGPQIVRDLVSSGRQVFLDLKLHDIPNTVGAAVKEAGKLGVSMLTVHGSGGTRDAAGRGGGGAHGESRAVDSCSDGADQPRRSRSRTRGRARKCGRPGIDGWRR